MSVIAVNSRRAGGNVIAETDEFNGLWINAGVLQASPKKDVAPNFVRLPRGIAVSDLKPRKIYDNMDPEFAASANLMNQLILEIQKKALTLAEGESVPINLEVQLYRRQEESATASTPVENEELSSALFGT
jgi:hypothetical protein